MNGNAAKKLPRNKQSFQTAGNLLASTLRRYGIDKEIAKYQFVLHWKEIVGEQIAARTRPEGIQGGVLTVRVVNSEWAQELSFQRELLVRRLNRYLEQNHTPLVTDVRFLVGSITR